MGEILGKGRLVPAEHHVVQGLVFQVGHDGDLAEFLYLDLIQPKEGRGLEAKLFLFFSNELLEYILYSIVCKAVLPCYILETPLERKVRKFGVEPFGHVPFFVDSFQLWLEDHFA